MGPGGAAGGESVTARWHQPLGVDQQPSRLANVQALVNATKKMPPALEVRPVRTLHFWSAGGTTARSLKGEVQCRARDPACDSTSTRTKHRKVLRWSLRPVRGCPWRRKQVPGSAGGQGTKLGLAGHHTGELQSSSATVRSRLTKARAWSQLLLPGLWEDLAVQHLL